ncbi:hypothetical protein BX260_6707 [Streptomyces sp. 5112.2]|nr:hypothetical protein BX260_6707 [Streptomyces sp. 5112.2]
MPRLLAVVVARLHLPRSLAGGGEPLGDHPQTAHVRAVRRARRGGHHGPARAGRRRAQLGLPLHLDPGRLAVGGRPDRPGLRGGGLRVPALAARAGRSPRHRFRGPLADHVPGRRRPPPDRGEPRPPGGLPGFAAGAQRQRGRRPAPAGHLRRGLRRPGGGRGHRRHTGLAVAGRCPRLADRPLGPARRGHLGDPGRPAELHLQPADDLGGLRPGRPGGHRLRPAGRRGPLDGDPGRRVRADRRAGLRHQTQGVRPTLRHRRPGRLAAADAAGRVPLCTGPRLDQHPRRDGRGTGQRQPGLPLQPRRLTRRTAGQRGHVQPVQLPLRGGARPHRAHPPGTARLRQDAHVRQPRRAVRRGDRAVGGATRQLPAGVHPSLADHRGDGARRGAGPGGDGARHRRDPSPPDPRPDGTPEDTEEGS